MKIRINVSKHAYPNKFCKALWLIRRLSVYEPGSNIDIGKFDESLSPDFTDAISVNFCITNNEMIPMKKTL